MIYTSTRKPLLEKLYHISSIILDKKDELNKIHSLQIDLESLTPAEALKIFNFIASSDYSIEICKTNIDKITNIFYKPLVTNKDSPLDDHFLNLLSNENQNFLQTLSSFKTILRQSQHLSENEFKNNIIQLVADLNIYKNHYKKQETYLFPLFNKVLPQYIPYVNITKQYHNDFRYMLIELNNIERNRWNKFQINKLLGKIYFRIHLSIYREELVFFPMCHQYIHYDIKKYLYA